MGPDLAHGTEELSAATRIPRQPRKVCPNSFPNKIAHEVRALFNVHDCLKFLIYDDVMNSFDPNYWQNENAMCIVTIQQPKNGPKLMALL